jgi:hypothetical protein
VDWLNQISWPNALAGALLGASLLPVGRALYQVATSDANRHLMGQWFSHNITVESGTARLVTYRWRFRRRLFSRGYAATGISLADPAVHYSADLLLDREFLSLVAVGRKHDERALLVFGRVYPYRGHETKLSGAFLGLDYDKTPIAGLCLLTKQEVPEAEIRQCLADRVAVFQLRPSPLIRDARLGAVTR